MAIKRGQATAALKLKVETGVTDSGAAKYATRTISHINPDLDAEDSYAICTQLANLQTNPLNAIQRVDTATLTDEG